MQVHLRTTCTDPVLVSDLICFCRLGAFLVLYLVVLHSADTNSYHTGRFQAAGTTAVAALCLLHSLLHWLDAITMHSVLAYAMHTYYLTRPPDTYFLSLCIMLATSSLGNLTKNIPLCRALMSVMRLPQAAQLTAIWIRYVLSKLIMMISIVTHSWSDQP